MSGYSRMWRWSVEKGAFGVVGEVVFWGMVMGSGWMLLMVVR
jgi:hypothetical protein